MHIILIAPEFPSNQRNFARALKQAGAFVTGIGERPIAHLDGELRGWLDAYEQVGSVVDDPQMINAVRRVQARGPWVDRLEATIEAHILTAARVRQETRIPGQSVESALLCRDKPKMKAYLRSRGISTAATTAVSTVAEARAFAEAIGFPLIVKPRAGAGADGTSKANNMAELARALEMVGGGSVALEEFIEGHEGFYDTITVNGNVAIEFVSHYYPNVLPAMRNRHVSPKILATNRSDASSYDELKQMGRRVIALMGLDTCATHMEWFFGPKGLKFSEIGARPPGVGQWDVYNTGNDIDLYRQWAEGLIHGRVSQQPSRQYAAGKLALRPDRDGRIVGYEGLEEAQRRYGEHVVTAHLPPAGTPTQPVEAGYHANAWLIARHTDYDRLRHIMNELGRMIRVRAA
ncbi:MAG: ATP-grasp domain-containing protein [Myxococcota bacterium]